MLSRKMHDRSIHLRRKACSWHFYWKVYWEICSRKEIGANGKKKKKKKVVKKETGLSRRSSG